MDVLDPKLCFYIRSENEKNETPKRRAPAPLSWKHFDAELSTIDRRTAQHESAVAAFFDAKGVDTFSVAAATHMDRLRRVLQDIECLLCPVMRERLAQAAPPGGTSPGLRLCVLKTVPGRGESVAHARCTPFNPTAVSKCPWAHVQAPDGYLCVRLGTRKDGTPVFEYGHRLVLVGRQGPPRPGVECSHTCGNPACLNALHLTWESHRDNCLRRRL